MRGKKKQKIKRIVFTFDLNVLGEKKVHEFLSGKSFKERNDFLVSCIGERGEREPEKMSIYEDRLFSIVERAIDTMATPRVTSASPQTFSPPRIEFVEEKPAKKMVENKKEMNYNFKVSGGVPEKIDFEKQIDDFIDGGF